MDLQYIYAKRDVFGEEELTPEELRYIESRDYIDRRNLEKPCGYCEHAQEHRLLEYTDDGKYVGPTVQYMCMCEQSKKYFRWLKHGVYEWPCKHFSEIGTRG